MEKWIIPCNLKYYDVEGAFRELKKVDWKQSNKNIEVSDIVYIYVGRPISAIKYKCKVNKVLLDHEEIDDSKYVIKGEVYENYGNHMEIEIVETFDNEEFSLERMREHGVNGNIQSPRRVNPELEAILK